MRSVASSGKEVGLASRRIHPDSQAEAVSDEGGTQEPLLTGQAADHIRDLIVRHVLLPGQKIGQVELAKRVGISRSPLREALRTLASEGIVTYEANRGYLVSQLDTEDLAQIYRMRELLETELLHSIARPTRQQLTQLTSYNEQLVAAREAGSVADMLRANREFHFAIFDLSAMDLIQREILRLWQLSEGYRAAYLWLPDTRVRIVKEHREIIAALRDFDLPRIIELCTKHRTASEDVVIGLLAPH
jgi:DNA-binding GntR family transcriptional regulator